jgi:hypothetical protein
LILAFQRSSFWLPSEKQQKTKVIHLLIKKKKKKKFFKAILIIECKTVKGGSIGDVSQNWTLEEFDATD